MRIIMLLVAAVTLACEPMTPANPGEPDAGPADPEEEIMMAFGAGTERCGVPLDADSTGTSAYVVPHGDSVPKLWPAKLTVEESTDTVRFRVAPQEGTLWSNSVDSWSKPNWGHNCRRNGWGCNNRYAGLNPLFPDHLFDLFPEDFWLSFNNGDYRNKTYEYVLTEYLRKVPLEGRKCNGQDTHCVGDETVRHVRLDVGYRGWTNAYGCHVILSIVRDGGIERGDTVLGDPEFTVYNDPGPTIAIYTTYEEQSEAQRRRLAEGIRFLTAYGIQWDTLRHNKWAINFFATGNRNQQVITPRFFLYDPYELRGWWEPKPRVNNGGLRWLKRVVPPLGRKVRDARERHDEVKRLLEGVHYFSHEHHIARLDDSGVEIPGGTVASENWITMQEMVDGLTGIEGTRLPRIFVGNPTVPPVGASGGLRWLRRQLEGG